MMPRRLAGLWASALVLTAAAAFAGPDILIARNLKVPGNASFRLLGHAARLQ
jgi:hypothetical protein